MQKNSISVRTVCSNTAAATSIGGDIPLIVPVSHIGRFKGWFVGIEDVDDDKIEEVFVWDRWAKMTYRYNWKNNQFRLMTKNSDYEWHCWEKFPNPLVERELDIPASVKNQLPSGRRIVSRLEADIDADGVDELVILCGHPHNHFKEAYLTTIYLAIFDRGGSFLQEYFLIFLLELSDRNFLANQGNTFEPGSIRLCHVKNRKTKQLVVFWTDVHGSGHTTICDVFDIQIQVKDF